MPYKYEIINCQDPYNNSNIKRTYKFKFRKLRKSLI